MGNLVEETARVAAALERVERNLAPAPKPPPVRLGRSAELEQHRPTTILLSVPGLWQQFKPVPPDFFTDEGKALTIACPCGWHEPDEPDLRVHRLELGEMVACPGCDRFYFNGRVLYAARLPEVTDVE